MTRIREVAKKHSDESVTQLSENEGPIFAKIPGDFQKYTQFFASQKISGKDVHEVQENATSAGLTLDYGNYIAEIGSNLSPKDGYKAHVFYHKIRENTPIEAREEIGLYFGINTDSYIESKEESEKASKTHAKVFWKKSR